VGRLRQRAGSLRLPDAGRADGVRRHRDGFDHVRLSLFEHFDGDMDYRADVLARVADLDEEGRHRALYSQALDVDAPRFAEVVRVLADAGGAVLIHASGARTAAG
jgi:hypothetical protein